MPAEQAAKTIISALQNRGHQAYLIGGCVRDLLLGRDPKDYDVTTDATPEQVMGIFPQTIPVGAAFGVVVVVVRFATFDAMVEDIQIEVATFRADGDYTDGRRPDTVRYSTEAREDVIRRDFTINGLLLNSSGIRPPEGAVTIKTPDGMVVDYVGGLADLKGRVIRCIGNPVDRFTEDSLRMLRAVRFAAQLDFEIEATTEAAIVEKAETIHRVSQERIAAELMKLVSAPFPVKGLVLLATTGLLAHVLPAVMHGGNFARTLQRFARFATVGEPLRGMAMLLADVGGHELARDVCQRLKLSSDDTEMIVGGVKHQLGFVLDLDVPLASIKMLARKPGIGITLQLVEQNWLLHNEAMPPTLRARIDLMRSFTQDDIRPKPLATGDDLIAMGLKPGPLFTKLLRAVEIEQLNGALTTPAGAIKFIQEQLLDKSEAAGI